MSQFERSITFSPAYDKRHPEPDKNYGIGSVRLRFLLKGERGAIQFVVLTGWQLPHVTAEQEGRYDNLWKPMAADLGYHSPTPTRENHKPMENCDVLGGDCYYDGSTMNAEPVFERLLAEGDDGVWTELEDYYRSVFRVSP